MENFEVNDNTSDVIEQPRLRGGRQVGSTNRHSAAAVVKLRQLGFDPIENLVTLYHKIEKEIKDMEDLKSGAKVQLKKDGSVVRYSSMAHATLLGLQQKLVQDLMRYGYARVPESMTVDLPKPEGLVINLTPKGGKFLDPDEDDE